MAVRTVQQAQAVNLGLAWAYMATLGRGDWAKASIVLLLFQEAFLANRGAILDAAYPNAAQRTAASRASAALASNGRFDAATRYALSLTLGVVREPDGSRFFPASVLNGLPEAAALLGPWFRANLASRGMPTTSAAWNFDRVVQTTGVSQLRAKLRLLAQRVFAPGDRRGSVTSYRYVPDTPAPTTTPPARRRRVEVDELRIPGERVKGWFARNWPWLLGGVFLATTGGVLGYRKWRDG